MTTAYSVRMTSAAERDLGLIVDNALAYRSAESTELLLTQILECIATLETFPERGAAPAELGALGIKEFRQLVVYPYRLIYRVIATTVIVMLIADGRQDMQALLERRLLEH